MEDGRLMEVVAKLRLGLTDSEVAKISGLAESTVAKIRGDAVEKGLVKSIDRVTHDERKDFRKRVAAWVKENGATSVEAAEKFSTSTAMVTRACKEFGVTLKPVGMRAPPGVSQLKVVAMLIDGIPPMEVAESLGVTKQYVSDCARKGRQHGIFDAVDRRVEKAEKEKRATAKAR